MDFFETFVGDVGIDLRGGDGSMTEHRLDGAGYQRHFRMSRSPGTHGNRGNYFPAVSKKQSAFAVTSKSISQGRETEKGILEKTLTAEDVRPGDMVEHPQFGSGLIVSIQGALATIAFKRKGVKKMMLGVAPLQKI